MFFDERYQIISPSFVRNLRSIYELNVMYQEKKSLGPQSISSLECLKCLKCHTENCHTETANKYLLKISFLLQQLSPKSLQKMGLNWYDRKNFPRWVTSPWVEVPGNTYLFPLSGCFHPTSYSPIFRISLIYRLVPLFGRTPGPWINSGEINPPTGACHWHTHTNFQQSCGVIKKTD